MARRTPFKPNPVPLKKQNACKVKNIAAYIEAKTQRMCTTFVISASGFFYLENDKLTPAFEYERRADIQLDSRSNENVDGSKNWM